MSYHDTSAPAAAVTESNTRLNSLTTLSDSQPATSSYDAAAKSYIDLPGIDDTDYASGAPKADIGLSAGNKAETLSMFQDLARLSKTGSASTLPEYKIDFGLASGVEDFEARGQEQQKHDVKPLTEAAKESATAPHAIGISDTPAAPANSDAPKLPSARAVLGLPELPSAKAVVGTPELPSARALLGLDKPEAPAEKPAEVPRPIAPTPQLIGVTENPFIRSKLEEANIDPSKTNGIKIGVIDRNFPNGHGSWVESVINNKDAGLIPGSDPVEIYNTYQAPAFSEYKDKPDGVNSFIHDSTVDFVKCATKHINKLVQANEPDMRVVNMSFGVSNTKIAETIMNGMTWTFDPVNSFKAMSDLIGPEKAQKLVDNAKGGELQDNKLRQELMQELMQAVVARVNEQVAKDPEFKQAMEDYREATKTAADHGINIVVSTGNQQDKLKFYEGIKTEPGAHYNYLAQSDDVISVGATNINETEGNRSDDTMAAFSSHGTTEYSPTLVTHGDNVRIDDDLNSTGVSGTSYSTPEVAATVALMLAQNPNLTAKEVKAMLQENTVKIPDTPKEAQGAGILISEQAIIAAKKSAA